MKKNLLLRLLLLFISLTSISYAQGSLVGTVTDSLNNDGLVGANVFLVGTSLGSAVDIDGHYRITRIPEGQYTVKISYIGYTGKEFNITIEDNRTIELNASLAPQILSGDEVIVSAQALGQAAAINQQLSSNTIVNVVSEQKIQELSDANAAEAIGRLPGVSLQRSGGEANKIVLRGLSNKYSTITVDGIRMPATAENDRGIDLSTLSQGSLAGIELYKALTADKDADAIAGTVNLVTKRAPEDRLIRFDVKGAYNKIDNDAGQYDFGVRYGQRFFDNLFGVQAAAHAEQKIRSRENTNINYDQSLYAPGSTEPYTDYQITDFIVLYRNETRQRQGGELILDFDTPDDGTIKFSNNYNKTSRDFIDYSRNYPTADASGVRYLANPQKQDIDIFQSSLTGENYFLGFEAKWGMSFAQSLADNPYNYEFQFTEPSSTNSAGEIISGMLPIPNDIRSRGPVEDLIPYAVNNFSSAYAWGAFFTTQRNLDREKTAYLDLKSDYTISKNLTGSLKFGGKYRWKNRYRIRTRLVADYYLVTSPQYARAADGSLVLKDFSDSKYFSNYDITQDRTFSKYFINDDFSAEDRNVFDKYKLYPLLNRDKIEEWWKLNKNGVTNDGTREYLNDSEANAVYYNVTEEVAAGYLMNTLNMGDYLTFIAGLRVETEDNFYKSKNAPFGLSGFPTPAGIIEDTSSTHIETQWLPNFQFLIKPSDFLNIRLAAYKALARPDFNYRLAQFIPRSGGFNIDGAYALTVGNPGLLSAKAWNFEINTSFYGNEIGLFSISAFYKDISDMFRYLNGATVQGQSILDSLGVPGQNIYPASVKYDLYYPYNSTKQTRVWGFEIEHQAYLGFLPGLLKNITLSYNFSIIRSEAYTPYTYIRRIETPVPGSPFPKIEFKPILIEKKQKLEGQPEFYGNFAIGYDIAGFSGRLSVFHQGEYFSSYSDDGRGDNIRNAYTKVDLALKQQVTDYLSVLLNVNNLTNTKEVTTIYNSRQDWRLENTAEIYGLSADLGVRITL
ncbi:MAG: TonB-dependent receptor [Ignavibacteriales bacterium]|nr:TonB-dependent receptor [Ignavibacteriales bacterium]